MHFAGSVADTSELHRSFAPLRMTAGSLLGDKDLAQVPRPQAIAASNKSRVLTKMSVLVRVKWAACFMLLAATASFASAADLNCPQTTSALYSRVRSVGLDPQRVYQVREASIDRPNLHLDFEDGTLAFTEDICGRITGAFFEGEGEIRLRPPNRRERGSLSLFTGMAILVEHFTSGYLRFNDDTAAVLKPFLAPLPEESDFFKRSDGMARELAEFDALRLLLDFSHFLPSTTAGAAEPKLAPMLHAHLIGTNLGAFEVFFDAATSEPIWAGQPRLKDGTLFFDIWTAFSTNAPSAPRPAADATITSFKIRASVEPPTILRASTEVSVRARTGGERTLLFELSRYQKVTSVESGGHALDFIQNPAREGTQLQRRGNDLIAIVFPEALRPGAEVKLNFVYAGEVLSDAGNGLLLVGDRGTWYPNFGLSPARFDLEFRYPQEWTLVATGKASSPETASTSRADTGATDAASAGSQHPANAPPGKVSRWISERPIPVAGFNLGKYVRAQANQSGVSVEAFANRGVEKSFPKAPPQLTEPFPELQPRSSQHSERAVLIAPPPPSPARNAQAVADQAAKAITNFSRWFGPYPYGSLALTQMPGNFSQGWPGLIFLSSFAFLSPREQLDLHMDSLRSVLDNQVLVHETAHQWWGDLVLWTTYRDQWIAEGLANYSSLLLLEQQNPLQFEQVLESYRRDLSSTDKEGARLRDAGPVTLGQRLQSSHFPGGYDTISYERGTWLFHMLRCMLRDSAAHSSGALSRSRAERKGSVTSADEPFFHVLRKVRDRYAGKSISTEELVQAFEEDLPRPLWYEHRPKLNWFLEGWVNGTAIPELSVSDVHIAEKNGVTTVTGSIVQRDIPEDLVTAVPVYGVNAAGALIFLGEVLADGAESGFRLTSSIAVHKIVLDPRHTILSAK